MNPVARGSDVIVQEVGTDVLVYDQSRDTAHSLNATAAFVYRQADGTLSVEELAIGMSGSLGVPDDVVLVEATLGQLARVHLLDASEPLPRKQPRTLSRRAMVRRLGVAAIAIPVVTSILTPTSLMAQSQGLTSPMTSPPSNGGPPWKKRGSPLVGRIVFRK